MALYPLGVPHPLGVGYTAAEQSRIEREDQLKKQLRPRAIWGAEQCPQPEPPIELGSGGCTLAMKGRGDCEHYIGLPGRSVPGQHDGPDDTVDVYGKPNGWCWSCWKSHQIKKLRGKVEELETASKCYASMYLNEMHARNNRALSEKQLELAAMGDTTIARAIDKLSGDLSYNDVAEAKEILRGIIT